MVTKKAVKNFTLVVALALVFGACKKEEVIIPNGGNKFQSAASVATTDVGFLKVKLIDGVEVPATAGEFTFDLYGPTSNGNNAPMVHLAVLTTDANGWVAIGDKVWSNGRKYYITEREAEGYFPLSDQYENGELHFTVDNGNKQVVWADFGNIGYRNGPVVVNIPIPEEEDERELEKAFNATVTNVAGGVVPNGNGNFLYAKIDRADLVNGVTLDVYESNGNGKLRGEMFVQLVSNEEIKISIDGVLVSFGAVAFNYLPEPHNGNIHTMNEFKNNNKDIIACPDGDVIYFYFKGDVRFYK